MLELLYKVLEFFGLWRSTRRKAAIALCDATRDLQWAVWEWVSLHTQHGIAWPMKDLIDEQEKILRKFESAFRVFLQDYDLPVKLAVVLKDELRRLNIGLANLKAFAMTRQEGELVRTAQSIQGHLEKIREAAEPYVYGFWRRVNEDRAKKAGRGENI